MSRSRRTAAASLILMAWLLCPSCRRPGRPIPDSDPREPYEPGILPALLSQYPMVVAPSPDGTRLLVKTRHEADFELAVVDLSTGQIVRRSRSAETQLGLAWSPDGNAIAFLDNAGSGLFGLRLWDLATGDVRRMEGASTSTASAPLTWSPTGTWIAFFRGAGRVGTLDLAAPAASSLTDGGVRLAQKRLARTPTRPDGGYDWSPDGRWLSVPAADTGSIMIVSPGGAPARRFELAGSGDVSDTAWSPTGDSVLATVRGAGDEFYRLKEVRVSDGHVETRAAPAFDVLRPLWIPGGSGYVYHVSQGARLAAVATDSCGAHRPFAQTLGGSAEVVGFSSRSREVLMIHRGEAAPPRLLAEPSCGGTPRELFRPDGAEGPRAVGPQDLVLRAADGVQVPAFLWQSPNPPVAGRVAVIGVHGGPHLQETPAWDAGVQWLVRQGIDVLRPNYRGSTHYGRRFERDDSVEGQVLDILAVRDHAMRVLGVEPGRIVLLGESHGATLVGHVLARAGARYGGVVLLSPVGAFPAGRAPGLYFSLAFHGRRDPLVTPDQAYASLLSFFGETLRPPRGLWRVFPGEGHHFHRTGSWAEIYSVLLRRIRQLPAAHGVPDLQGLRRDPAPQRQSP